MSVAYNVKDLYSGVLNKCGAKFKSWNKRWFVLKSDYSLYYYKDTAKGPLGVISLRDPKFKVRRGAVGDTAWPKGVTMERSIAVVTTHRTYCMYSVSADEADEWVKVLDKTRERLIEEANSPIRSPLGTQSFSESSRKAKEENETCTKLLSESTPSPAQLAMDGHEETYEAVYDSPEADLSQNSSPNDTPSLNTKVAHTSTSSQGVTSGTETDSIYDLANAEDTGQDESQPLYAEAAAPDNEEDMDEPSAVYDHVEVHLQGGEKPHNGGEKRERVESQELYDDVTILGPSSSPSTVVNGNSTGVEMYEPIDTDSPLTSSAKHLPLPPVPLTSHTPSGVDGPLPIYEDIPDPSGVDKPQPLYEDVIPEGSSPNDRFVPEAERSDDEEERQSHPPLPPKDDLPPLPPKDDLPPLPPKDDLPPLPPKDAVPELPPKNSLPSSRQNVPTIPPKDTAHLPTLPPKDDVTDDQCNKRGIPPLPPKVDEPEESRQPVASPRQSQSFLPPTPPPHRRKGSGSSEDSLSPSSQKKPIPRERTLTPPPPAMTKPAPAPRRRVSPSTGSETSSTKSNMNGHTPPSPSPAARVTVQVTSPTEREKEELDLHGNGMFLSVYVLVFLDMTTLSLCS